MAEELLLTQEGYDKIVAEHEELVSVRRKEISEKLKEAISYGDLSENAEYDAAKNEQAELEERIFKLEDMMKKAKLSIRLLHCVKREKIGVINTSLRQTEQICMPFGAKILLVMHCWKKVRQRFIEAN